MILGNFKMKGARWAAGMDSSSPIGQKRQTLLARAATKRGAYLHCQLTLCQLTLLCSLFVQAFRAGLQGGQVEENG